MINLSSIGLTPNTASYEVDLSKFNLNSQRSNRISQKNLEKEVKEESPRRNKEKKNNKSRRHFLSQNRLNKQKRIDAIKSKKTNYSSKSRSESFELSVRSSIKSKKLKNKIKENIPKITKIYYTDKLIEGISLKNPDNSYIKHFEQSTQSILYVKNIKKPTDEDLVEKRVYLPPQLEPKKTLIFDLDETLIHCNKDSFDHCDSRIDVKFPSGEKITIGITIRPFARKCLKKLSKEFEIVIFTASHSCYANEVINLLDPKNEIISARIFREHCYKTPEGIFVKDLRVFANRNEENILIVDNAVYSYGFNLENGVPLLPFYGDKKDAELLELTEFLIKMKGVSDLRKIVRKYFMVNLYEKYAGKMKSLKKKILLQRNKLY